MKRFELTFEGTDVERLPVHIETRDPPNDGPPDVICMGDGFLFVLVGKPLDGRSNHFTYREARVHEMLNVVGKRKD